MSIDGNKGWRQFRMDFRTSLRKRLQSKRIKFVLAGGVAASFNLLFMIGLIDFLGFDTAVLRNVANAISVELSLIASFFLYRLLVWPGGSWEIRQMVWEQLPLYHMSGGAAIISRIFFAFPVLDWQGIHYVLNTLVGVGLGATINYVLKDRLVFRSQIVNPHDPNHGATLPEIYYPEGLGPVFIKGSGSPNFQLSRSEEHSDRTNGQLKIVSVVIPAHNEAGSIVRTIESICHALEKEEISYEILVINDHSTDRTEELVHDILAHNTKVVYKNNYYPKGFGFAVRCGLENFRGDAVVIVMADCSDEPKNIVDYFHILQEGWDCVFGSRFIKGAKAIDYPIHKLIVNRLANGFIQMLFGLEYNDTTNAFKMYRKEVIEGICPLLSHHFNLTVEMPLKAIVRGFSYTTIPITWRNRTSGISKLKITEMGSRYLFIVFSVFLEKLLSRGDYVRTHTRLGTQNLHQ